LPVRVNDNTVTLHFKDDGGEDIPDATYTIRVRLDADSMTEYTDATMRIHFDTATQTMIGGDMQTRPVEDALMRCGLLSWSGVEDVDGSPLPLEKWRKLDPDLTRQILRELQQRNVVRAREHAEAGPNGAGLSGPS
jgi:hypothetical protein